MRLAFLAILAGLLALGGHATPPEPTPIPAGPPIPDTIVGARATDGYPVFVAAEAIFAKDGSYNSSVFSPETIDLLLETEKQDADRGCILSSGYIAEHTLDPSNTLRRFLSTRLRQAFS